jgi:hypothetical protein
VRERERERQKEKLNMNVHHCYLEDERKVPWPLGKLLSRFECKNVNNRKKGTVSCKLRGLYSRPAVPFSVIINFKHFDARKCFSSPN